MRKWVIDHKFQEHLANLHHLKLTVIKSYHDRYRLLVGCLISYASLFKDAAFGSINHITIGCCTFGAGTVFPTLLRFRTAPKPSVKNEIK